MLSLQSTLLDLVAVVNFDDVIDGDYNEDEGEKI